MIKRTVEISAEPAKLSLKLNQLVIARDGKEAATVPIEDLGTLVISHRQAQITAAALDALMKAGTAVVICDEKHLPSGMLLPFSGNSQQSKIMSLQVAAAEPIKKRLWQSVIKAKITGQARMLSEAGAESGALKTWAGEVRSGDPDNLEGQAARFYWPRLFGAGFIRDRNGATPNGLLNYGYAIIRASVARALVGAGLHPSLGIHHRNQYNDFLLADDLMEPLRPFVDRAVYALWKEDPERGVGKATKQTLLGLMGETLEVTSGKLPFEVALGRYAASFRRALEENEPKHLDIPEW